MSHILFYSQGLFPEKLEKTYTVLSSYGKSEGCDTLPATETYKSNISLTSPVIQKKYIYHQYKVENKEYQNKWLDSITSLTIDFSREEAVSSFIVLSKEEYCIEKWAGILRQFDKAIATYIETLKEVKHIKKISNTSAKHFLYLVPTISKYDPSISIDADTGYFNLTFKSKDHGIMTVLITERGDIHYSLAERGRKLVKFSGTAKIKDPHDFAKFNKVLSML